MKTIRTSALLTISIVALLLLLTPEYLQNEAASSGNQPSSQKLVAANEPRASTSFERAPAGLAAPSGMPEISRRARRESTVSPEIARSTDWTRMLYPELARIEELESAPAHAALDELLPMLASDDPAVRLAAAESIGDMILPNLLPILSMTLNDPDPLVRVTAMEALASAEDKAAASSIEPYLYDDDRAVRAAAIDALAELEAESAVPALAGLLSDRDPSIRRQAVYALGDIGGKTAITYLLQARYDANAAIRIDAEAILAELEYSTGN